jgi:cytochrome P450
VPPRATGKADAGGRDLLSLLVRASMSENAAQRLSDDEILARACPPSTCAPVPPLTLTPEIPTFILAGHETTSTAMTWALFELAQHPALQARLRAELRTAPLPGDAGGNEPLDADALAVLDKLPLLDAVVRETMRLRTPVQRVRRVAAAPAAVPLAAPFVDRHGVRHESFRVAAGDQITVPILAVQRSPALWGADAGEWKCVRRACALCWLSSRFTQP